MSTVELKGFKELDAELSKLALKVQRKIMSKAVREATKVVQREAKRLAPKRVKDWEGVAFDHPAGTLRKSIVVRKVRKTPKWIVRYVALPLPGLLISRASHKAGGLDKKTSRTFTTRLSNAQQSYYAMWVEYGHKMRGGKHYSGTPFMRPAFDKNKGKILQVMRREMAKGIKNYRKG